LLLRWAKIFGVDKRADGPGLPHAGEIERPVDVANAVFLTRVVPGNDIPVAGAQNGSTNSGRKLS